MAEGIHQAWLKLPDGRLVDPDDGRIDFAGDAMYVRDSARSAHLQISLLPSGMETDWKLEPVDTYAQDFPTYDSLHTAPGGSFAYADFLRSPARLRQFAIVGAMEYCLELYRMQYGHYPVDIDDFIISGFSPVNRVSINPVTGEYFYFDGSPNDIFYRVSEDLQGRNVQPVLGDGTLPGGINIY